MDSHSACSHAVQTAQLVAYELGKALGNGHSVEMSLIRVGDTDSVSLAVTASLVACVLTRPTQSIVPNAMFTGGSTGSEGTAEAARRAAAQLVKVLDPIKVRRRQPIMRLARRTIQWS